MPASSIPPSSHAVAPPPFVAHTRRVQSTRRLGKLIGAQLHPGAVLGLTGDLGAGKTSFVQGLAQGLGKGDLHDVVSPTYTLANIYEGGRVPLVHMDFYRLESPDAVYALGLDQYLLPSSPGPTARVVVIEWADRFAALMPPSTVWIRFETLAGAERRLTVQGMDKPPGWPK